MSFTLVDRAFYKIRSVVYADNLVITYAPASIHDTVYGTDITSEKVFNDPSKDPHQLWKAIMQADGSYAFQCKDNSSIYIGTAKEGVPIRLVSVQSPDDNGKWELLSTVHGGSSVRVTMSRQPQLVWKLAGNSGTVQTLMDFMNDKSLQEEVLQAFEFIKV